MGKRGTRRMALLLKNKILPKPKRSQVTIFIITGVVIISAIALFFLFRSGVIPDIGEKPETNPNKVLHACLDDKIKESLRLISSQGGSVNPELYREFKFSDERKFTNISYLCYTQNDYISCVNQKPMLIRHLKNEIKNYINEPSDEVEICFDELNLALERQGYEINSEYTGFDVDLKAGKVSINIDAEIVLTKTGETSKKEDFEVIVPSKFYDIALVVQEIVSKEAEYCQFEDLGYMLVYPEFNIDRFRTGDSIIIYTVKHRESKEKFRFAVRGCVLPPGV